MSAANGPSGRDGNATSEVDDTISWEVEPSGVAWLTLRRPEAGNAIAPPQRDRIIELMAAAGGDPVVRCIVITGTGSRHFCTGGDLGHPNAQRAAGEPLPVGWVQQLISQGVQRMTAAVLDCPKPVIAAVNGTAAGIGCHLAFACDLVVCSEQARFIELFVRRGLVADAGGAHLLSRTLGPHQIKELLFFGDDLPATEAHRLGLVNRLVPHDEVQATARALAERLAAAPTVSIGAMKGLVNNAYGQSREAAMRDEANACELNSRSEDFAEGLRAFAERREPVWRGR
jgi:2-(1,2-epoxy-1,2-dihydrophenyl)acetyl-CoA isomerase